MLKADSLEQLENLLEKHRVKAEKAISEGLLVIVTVSFGHYRCTGSKGNVYDCFAGRNNEKGFWISCTCLGSLHNGSCFHSFAVFHFHRELAQKMINEKKGLSRDSDKPYLKPSSNKKPEKIGNIRI